MDIVSKRFCMLYILQLQNTPCQFQKENVEAQLFTTKLYYLWKPAFPFKFEKTSI